MEILHPKRLFVFKRSILVVNFCEISKKLFFASAPGAKKAWPFSSWGLEVAVERLQKLEDRRRTQERTIKGKEEARKRGAASATREATRAPMQQRRSGGAGPIPAVEAGEGRNLHAPGAAEDSAGGGAGHTTARSRCPHDRIRSRGKECRAAGLCPRQRRRSRCTECGGASICQHQRQRSPCTECGGASSEPR